MPIFNGTNNIANIYKGNTQITKVYQGNDLKYELSLFGTYELIADVIVTSNTTQIDFDNLNITKDDNIQMFYTFLNDSTTQNNLFAYINDNTSDTNYKRSNFSSSNTSMFFGNSDDPRISYSASGRLNSGYISIKLSNTGQVVMTSQAQSYIGINNRTNDNYNLSSEFTVSSINKISLIGSLTNGIATGSRFQLFKVSD